MSSIKMRSFKSLDFWLAYLSSAHPKEIDLGLDRISKVFQALNIAFDCPVITVAGTNGKGSTCKYLESIFTASNYKVACMTSPHLLRFNERACVGNQEISDSELIYHFEIIEETRKKLNTPVSLSFFEFTTLAIIHFFYQSKPDLVVLEVGMGGRLDAVNVVDADYAIITNIALDHTSYLGTTREDIALEKAGILRRNIPLVIGDLDPPKNLLAFARSLEASVYLAGKDFHWFFNENENENYKKWQYIGPSGKKLKLSFPELFGKNQLANASTALTMAELMEDKFFLDQKKKKNALKTCQLPGRFEILPGWPVRILDVAHNPHAARALAKNLADHGTYRFTHAVFGVFADKDILGIIKSISSKIDYWYLTLLPNDRTASLPLLISKLKEAGIKQSAIRGACDTPIDAYRCAAMHCKIDDRIVIFGSFFTVSALSKFI